MKKLIHVIMLGTSALIISSCAALVPNTSDDRATMIDSTYVFGRSPVGGANTPGTFRTDNYGPQTLAIQGTANTTGPSPAPNEMANYNSPVAVKTISFLRQLGLSEMSDLKLSQIAVSRSKNPTVNSYASKIIDDHNKAIADLILIARAKGVTMPDLTQSIPVSLNEKMKELNKASDVDFDKKYIKQMIKDHEEAIQILEKGAKSDNQDVLHYRLKYLPIFKMNLKNAGSIQPQ